MLRLMPCLHIVYVNTQRCVVRDHTLHIIKLSTYSNTGSSQERSKITSISPHSGHYGNSLVQGGEQVEQQRRDGIITFVLQFLFSCRFPCWEYAALTKWLLVCVGPPLVTVMVSKHSSFPCGIVTVVPVIVYQPWALLPNRVGSLFAARSLSSS